MNHRPVILSLFLLLSIPLCAQERKPWVLRVLRSVADYIDSSAVRGIDQRYIQVPEKPWAVTLKYHVNDMDMRSLSSMSEEHMAERGETGDFNWETVFQPRSESSIGAWIGYRGYGLGYSYSFRRSQGRNFSIGMTGANYGLNLRTRRFRTNQIDVNIWGHDEDGAFEFNNLPAQTWEDIKVKTAILDGFYMFNSKRFSYAAAYDQSTIQVRSAGSFMLGLMWFQTSLDYSARQNALFIQSMGDIGRIKIHEGSIGVGYAYNWVPVRNLLINVTAMPMVALYNRTKIYRYDSNYDLFLKPDEVSPTGKKHVDYDLKWLDDITIEETGTAVKYGKVSLNIDARVSATYNMGRFFVNAYGQVNHYHNSIEGNTLKLTDWYVNASLGYRF